MTRALLILGCGGHGRVVADAARACGYDRIAFLDDSVPAGAERAAGPVIGPFAELEAMAGDWPEAIAAVGDGRLRLSLFAELERLSFETPTIVHPAAVVSRQATLGRGVFVAAGSIVCTGARIADAVIVNTGASIDHDCDIGEGCHIAPGATLSGTVTVARLAWLGTGCSVHQSVRIGEGAIVGVGAAVIGDLDGGHTYVGVPARPLVTSTGKG